MCVFLLLFCVLCLAMSNQGNSASSFLCTLTCWCSCSLNQGCRDIDGRPQSWRACGHCHLQPFTQWLGWDQRKRMDPLSYSLTLPIQLEKVQRISLRTMRKRMQIILVWMTGRTSTTRTTTRTTTIAQDHLGMPRNHQIDMSFKMAP